MHVRMRPELVEALTETAEAMTVSRNVLVEMAVEEYLRRLDLTGLDTPRRD